MDWNPNLARTLYQISKNNTVGYFFIEQGGGSSQGSAIMR